MSITIMKFGGTSVANIGRIEKLAGLVKKIVSSKKSKIVLVVSAMSGVTNRLAREYKEFGGSSLSPEYDVVLSTGEQYSSAIISSFLVKNKIKARSLLGWQIPIITDSLHGKARIKKINSKMLKVLFKSYDVLVVAGFQGVDNQGRITTLGRGGSDTSAVALSVALQAKECQILTDVDGIYTSDPRNVKKAKKINFITFEETLEMSSLGSKVLHPRSVELAMKYGIKIHVRSSFVDRLGTMVVKEENKMEKEVVTGISSSDNDAKITIKGIPDKPGIAAQIFGLLATVNVNVDMIVQNVTDDGKFASITFTVNKNDYLEAVKVLKNSKIKYKNLHLDKNICKISIVGVGMKSNVGVAQKMFETLAKKNINIQVISTSEIKISVLIATEKKNAALNALHKAYKLES